MDTLSNETFTEIEKFANNLISCFESKKKGIVPSLSLTASVEKNMLKYAIEIVNLHLEFVRKRFEIGCAEMERAYGEGVGSGK